MSTALDAVVSSFIDDVSAAVQLAGNGRTELDQRVLRGDVTVEAFNLATAIVDADDRHTVDELEALIDAFGQRMPDTQLNLATPSTLQGGSLVVGAKRWLDADSQLFGLLLDADRRDGTHLAERYYERALDIAHVVASLDVVPSPEELRAISQLRSRLLSRLRQRDLEVRLPARHDDDEVTLDARPDTPVEPPRPLEDLLAELDELIGLEAVKERVHLVADLLQVQRLRADRGLPTVETSHHLVFTGNPGTGKTTVARLLAQIYRTLGVVERGHLVEVDRSALVAGFVGQTAPLVTERFDEADEGMLFIDEAYTLARGNENDFGREAIDQMVKLMEDRRDSVVVVVAGYPEEMDSFLSTNPGLRSRFPTVIEFPDYDTDQIIQILDVVGTKQRYHLDDGARAKLAAVIDSIPRDKGFGNARAGRNLFEAAVRRHASRVVRMGEPDEAMLTTITAEDIEVDRTNGAPK